MRTWWFRKAAWFTGAAILWLLVMGGIVMLLWNALLPDILNTPPITFIQAVGLLLLSHILFRGVGRWGRHRNGWHHYSWKHKFEEKLAAMAPEEREKFREEWRRRCGWDPGDKAEESKGEYGVGSRE